MRSVREVLESVRMACATHLVGLILAQLHLVHLVAVEAANIFLAVRADAPLTIRDRMATLADFRRDRQRHLRLVGMVILRRAMARFTTDAFMRERARLAVELAHMADEAFPFLTLVRPLVQENVVNRMGVGRSCPLFRFRVVADHTTVGLFLFVGPNHQHGCHQNQNDVLTR